MEPWLMLCKAWRLVGAHQRHSGVFLALLVWSYSLAPEGMLQPLVGGDSQRPKMDLPLLGPTVFRVGGSGLGGGPSAGLL